MDKGEQIRLQLVLQTDYLCYIVCSCLDVLYIEIKLDQYVSNDFVLICFSL